MGLADEILGLVADHVTAWLGDAGGRVWIPDVTRTREVLKARLTAIEQELGSLRMDALQAESQRVGLYEESESVGRIEGGGDRPSVVNARRPSASESFGLGKIGSGTTQPSDLDASHAVSALPCPSEYVNAQTGYDSEDGG